MQASEEYPVYPTRSRRPRIPDPHAVTLGVDCSDPDPANWTYFGDEASTAATQAAERQAIEKQEIPPSSEEVVRNAVRAPRSR